MFIDITLKITPKMVTDAQGNEKKSLVGHLGTHFDVMNKEFPIEYVERKGIEHTPKDQYCANRGVFIIENLCNLNTVLSGQTNMDFIANTYPVNYAEMTGLPCRVVVKL